MSRRLILAIAASAAQVVICIAGESASAQGTPFSFTSPNPPVAIPDLATTIDTFTVSQSGTIEDLNVFVDLDHTYMGDLDIFLEHNGISAHLFDEFGAWDNDLASVLFDDEAATLISAGTPPYGPGSFQPSPGLLAGFDGVDIQGAWSLRIVDSSLGDAGTLFIFRIEGTFVAVFVPTVPEGARDPIDFEVEAALNQIAGQLFASDPNGDLALLFTQLGTLGPGEVSDALKQFAHEEVPAQADFSLRNLRTHLGHVRDRHRTLRGPDNGSGIRTASVGPLGEILELAEAPLDEAAFFASAGLGERVALPAISAPDGSAPIVVWIQGEGHFGDKDATVTKRASSTTGEAEAPVSTTGSRKVWWSEWRVALRDRTSTTTARREVSTATPTTHRSTGICSPSKGSSWSSRAATPGTTSSPSGTSWWGRSPGGQRDTPAARPGGWTSPPTTSSAMAPSPSARRSA